MPKIIVVIGFVGKNKKLLGKLTNTFGSPEKFKLMQILLESDDTVHNLLRICKRDIPRDTHTIVVINQDSNANMRSVAANIANITRARVLYCREAVQKDSPIDRIERNHLCKLSGVRILNFSQPDGPLHQRILQLVESTRAFTANQ
jgi:hypothetical protein